MSNTPLDATPDTLVDAILSGSIRDAARLITRIEHNDTDTIPVLQKLYKHGGSSQILGITGPPGAGKSTLVNQLIQRYRERSLRVAVLAVDPSSPFSGGAVLGDRVRMNQHASDPGVFIRSMASRGHLGGLSKATGDAIIVFESMKFDLIIIETVGVGQSEIDIIRHADTVLLLLTPESGDKIQTIKAGIMEIGDVYIVNKADHVGADEMRNALKEMILFYHAEDSWLPPVVATQAAIGVGMDEVLNQIDLHRQYLKSNFNYAQTRLKKRLRFRILEICQQWVQQKIFLNTQKESSFDKQLDDVILRESDPYFVARQIVGVD